MDKFIGVDLGGTNVRVAIVSEDGKVLQMVKKNTASDHIIDDIISIIEQLDGYKDCKGIGLAVPGPVDTIKGKMLLSSNLPGLAGYPITETISQHFGIPAYIDNDANAAGLGEALQGAGKGENICYYVTISTGIGGALIIDGKVVSGAHGYAGEIGNVIIDPHREKLSHLNAGAIENEASGMALERKGKMYIGEHIHNAGCIFQLASDGNESAIALVDQMAFDLAVLFSAIAHITDPSCFILGGGVMKSKDVFLDKVKGHFYNMIHHGMESIKFVEAQLEEPGIIGAAMLPISHIYR